MPIHDSSRWWSDPSISLQVCFGVPELRCMVCFFALFSVQIRERAKSSANFLGWSFWQAWWSNQVHGHRSLANNTKSSCWCWGFQDWCCRWIFSETNEGHLDFPIAAEIFAKFLQEQKLLWSLQHFLFQNCHTSWSYFFRSFNKEASPVWYRFITHLQIHFENTWLLSHCSRCWTKLLKLQRSASSS